MAPLFAFFSLGPQELIILGFLVLLFLLSRGLPYGVGTILFLLLLLVALAFFFLGAKATPTGSADSQRERVYAPEEKGSILMASPCADCYDVPRGRCPIPEH